MPYYASMLALILTRTRSSITSMSMNTTTSCTRVGSLTIIASILQVVQTITDNTTRLAKSLVTLNEVTFMTIPSIHSNTVNNNLGMSDSSILHNISLPM